MKNQFKKYRYLGSVAPETSEFWEPTILNMLKDIDKCIRPKYVPQWVLNFMHDISYKHGKRVNWYWSHLLNNLISDVYISQIKSKFATLRVYGIFTKEIQDIIDKTEEICNQTCENCGKSNSSPVMIKGWVTNLCATCKEINKK